MVKKFKQFNESHIGINSICEKYGITNYRINDDGSIDVNGDVDLSKKQLTKLPLKFRNVSRYFDCSNNQLVSLKGAPKTVGGYFYCENNKLIEGCTKSFVGKGFSFRNNQLIKRK